MGIGHFKKIISGIKKSTETVFPFSKQLDVALVMAPPFSPEEPPIGLAYIASTLSDKGFSVKVFDLNVQLYNATSTTQHFYWERTSTIAGNWTKENVVDEFLEEHQIFIKAYLEKILASKPKILGFSCHQTNSIITMKLIHQLRKEASDDLVIIAGGPAFYVVDSEDSFKLYMYGYPTSNELHRRNRLEEWYARLDAIVLDEGEKPIIEICNRVYNGRSLDNIGNVVQLKSIDRYEPFQGELPIELLDTIPHPTFKEFELNLYKTNKLPVLFNRGCIKRCTCCTERYRWGRFRYRSPENIVAELKHHVREYSQNVFNATDMLLNADIKRLESLCDLIIDEGLQVQWGGNMVVRKGMTSRLLQKMKKAGVNWCIFGIESGSPRIVEQIGKGFTLDVADKNLADCHNAGILTYINIIIGFPGETENDFQQTKDFIHRNSDHIDWVILLAMFEIFHHTHIALHPEKYHLTKEDVNGLDEEGFGIANWTDLTGNTPQVRRYRYAQMIRLLAELDLPDPTMQGTDIQPQIAKLRLVKDKTLHDMVIQSLDIDPNLDASMPKLLIELMGNDNRKIRAGAARMLGLIKDRNVVHALHNHLGDEDEFVRSEVIMALGRIANPLSVDHLQEKLIDNNFNSLPDYLQNSLIRLRRLYKAKIIEDKFKVELETAI